MSAARRKQAAPRARRTRASRNGTARVARTPAALMNEAVAARARSHSPYSNFAVGAALRSVSGKVYQGCNVENASFGLTCCAERTALFKAVSEGERDFEAIAVTARAGHGAPPCGACRQVLAEFSPNLWVYWRDMHGQLLKKRLTALLPNQFELDTRGGRRR